MTSTLKNRLVGTIIVVALVVIIVPEFLDGEKRTNKQVFVDVPPKSALVEVQNIELFDTSEVSNQVSQNIEVVDDLALDDDQTVLAEGQGNSEGAHQYNTSLSADSVRKKIAQRLAAEKAAAEKAAAEQPVSTDARLKIVRKKAPVTKEIVELDNIEVKESGWVVQLGSFRHQKNVKQLLKTLSDAGYRAYSRPVMTKFGELNKVFVGPELDKSKLERALPHLQEITELKGKITAFEVSAG